MHRWERLNYYVVIYICEIFVDCLINNMYIKSFGMFFVTQYIYFVPKTFFKSCHIMAQYQGFRTSKAPSIRHNILVHNILIKKKRFTG